MDDRDRGRYLRLFPPSSFGSLGHGCKSAGSLIAVGNGGVDDNPSLIDADVDTQHV